MKETSTTQTIIALSTPATTGAIAIVRLSGNKASEIARRLISDRVQNASTENKRSDSTAQSKLAHGKATLRQIDTGTIRDKAVLIYYKSPKSYTGEDVVEIHCHGSMRIVREIIRFAIENGARHAENGEFTKRAFLNGKMDLTQAESIMELIGAQTTAQINAAFEASEGALFKAVTALQNELGGIIAGAEAAMDYPEEDIEAQTAAQTKAQAGALLSKLNALKDSYNDGIRIKEGVRIALAGKPNAGKSLLLNRLLKKDRAIVSDIPGTTRDTLEECYEYKGFKFVLTDTAGIRDGGDDVERLGIERTRAAVDRSDIILAVFDAREGWDTALPDKPVIFVRNKIDLINADNAETAQSVGQIDKAVTAAANVANIDIVEISALDGTNLDELRERIYALAYGGISTDGAVITNLRHYDALAAAITALDGAERALGIEPLECVAIDLREAFDALGGITGAVGTEEIISRIFAGFCLGK